MRDRRLIGAVLAVAVIGAAGACSEPAGRGDGPALSATSTVVPTSGSSVRAPSSTAPAAPQVEDFDTIYRELRAEIDVAWEQSDPDRLATLTLEAHEVERLRDRIDGPISFDGSRLEIVIDEVVVFDRVGDGDVLLRVTDTITGTYDEFDDGEFVATHNGRAGEPTQDSIVWLRRLEPDRWAIASDFGESGGQLPDSPEGFEEVDRIAVNGEDVVLSVTPIESGLCLLVTRSASIPYVRCLALDAPPPGQAGSRVGGFFHLDFDERYEVGLLVGRSVGPGVWGLQIGPDTYVPVDAYVPPFYWVAFAADRPDSLELFVPAVLPEAAESYRKDGDAELDLVENRRELRRDRAALSAQGG